MHHDLKPLERYYALRSSMALEGSPLARSKSARTYYLAEDIERVLARLTEAPVSSAAHDEVKRLRHTLRVLQAEVQQFTKRAATLQADNKALREMLAKM